MTNNQLLKLIKESNIRNIWILFKWYITDQNFIIRDKFLADKLIKLYIDNEYNDLEKLYKKNYDKNKNTPLLEYSEYFSKRSEQLNNTNNKTIEFIEFLFKSYEDYNYDNISILEIKEFNQQDYIKLALKLNTNEYYVIDKKYIDIITKKYWENIYLKSKKYTDDYSNISPIAVYNENTNELIWVIMPFKQKLSDFYYNNL